MAFFSFVGASENTVIQNLLEADKNPENDKEDMEMNKFLLAYLTAKVIYRNYNYDW